MAEVAGARFAFDDEGVVIQVWYDDVTGHPTRVTSTTATRTIPSGTDEYTVPNGIASRVNFLADPPDVYLAATHAA